MDSTYKDHSTEAKWLRVVDNVILPPETTVIAGPLKYTFSYNDLTAPTESRGWGELREIIMPNGSEANRTTPRVSYLYQYSGTTASPRDAVLDTANRVLRKDLYRKELLPGTGTASVLPFERWSYTYPHPANGGTGSITSPDGGLTTNYFWGDTSSSKHLLIWKTVGPSGETTEKWWDINEPWIGTSANSDRKNVFVRAEYRKPTGTTAYSAIVFERDKNGNVKQQREFDYGVSIPRGTNQAPNGPPLAGTLLRATLHNYAVETQPSTAAPTQSAADSNSYWRKFDFPVKGAKIRTTIGSGSGAVLAATEWTYDNPLTTANVATEARWDNSRPGNSTLPSLGGFSAANSLVNSYTWNQGNLVPNPGWYQIF